MAATSKKTGRGTATRGGKPARPAPPAPGARSAKPTGGPHEQTLRAFALAFPGVREDFPWGHSAFKAREKVFLFMATEDGGLSLSVKLPESSSIALMLPFVEPTGYGLGKSGWVTATFKARQKPPVEVLRRWIEESYRAIAPRKLVAEWEGR